MTEIEYLNHKIIQASSDDPFSVFTSTGNLLGHFDNFTDAKSAARWSRIREVTKELYDLTSLRD